MKLFEMFPLTSENILNEVEVQSSWIEDLDIDGKDVIMTLLSGNTYRIYGFPKRLYNRWIEAESPGRFWHKFVARKYVVLRED